MGKALREEHMQWPQMVTCGVLERCSSNAPATWCRRGSEKSILQGSKQRKTIYVVLELSLMRQHSPLQQRGADLVPTGEWRHERIICKELQLYLSTMAAIFPSHLGVLLVLNV